MLGVCRRYLYTILIFAFVATLKLTFTKVFHPTPLLLLPLAVMYCAWFLGKGPGILASALCTALTIYLLSSDNYAAQDGTFLLFLRIVIPAISFFTITWLVNYIKWLGISRIKWSESQKQILSALENLDGGCCGVAFLDDDFKIVDWGVGAESMTGWTANDVRGQSIHRFFTGEDIRSGVPESLFEEVKKKNVWAGQLRVVRRNGSRFWILLIAFRLKVGFQGIAIDITKQKENEENLERWRHIFDHGGWSVCVVDAKTNIITHVNRAFVVMHKYDSEKELVGKPVSVLFSPEFIPDLPKHIQAVHMSKDDNYSCETQHIGKNGIRFPVETHISLFRDENNVPIYQVSICQDITSRRKLERDVRHSKEELRRVDEQKDMFMATLAHELRNPLQPIKTALHLYNETGTIDRETMERISRNIDQIQHHVDELMDIARINAGKIQLNKSILDIRDIINLAHEQVHPLIKSKKHKLLMSIPTQPVYLNADSVRLQQIVANLLNNAAKYTDEGGTIWITTETDDSHVIIKIKDTGAGISEDILPKVFDLYMQGNTSPTKSQGGLGLGLTIVKKMVESHGGTVTAASELGKGSVFTVCLPTSEVKKFPTPPNKPFSSDDVSGGRKILVVDDNIDAATSLQMMFSMDGCNVVVANDGSEALEAYENFHPDIVLLDIGLPKIDGFEVARRIRAISDKVTLIAVTGYGQPDDMQRSTEVGFDAHVIKPVEPSRFKKLVNSKFEEKSKRSEEHV